MSYTSKKFYPLLLLLILLDFTFVNTITTPTIDITASENVNVLERNYHSDEYTLAEQATHILIGQIETIESIWNDNQTLIYSYAKVHLEEYIKGVYEGQVVIKYAGGEVGDVGLWMSNMPSFVVGERCKFYLQLQDTGEFIVIDGIRGKVSLDDNNGFVTNNSYNYSGYHWKDTSLPVGYHINQFGTDDTTGEFSAIQNSFQTWEDDQGSYMDYIYLGTTSRIGEQKDGFNVVSWENIDGPEGILAQCTIWFNVFNQIIIETDIVFDDSEDWSTTGKSNSFDVQNIGTHEVGHTLLLEDLYDSSDSEETMYGYGSIGETKKRTLNAGDIAGIRHIYPIPTPENIDPSVLWIKVRERPGSRLDSGGNITLGKTVRIYTRVSDAETDASSLWVRIKYRVQGGSWITGTPIYSLNKNTWRLIWDIPLDAELGLYDVKVVVKDLDGGRSVKIEKGEFIV